MKSPRHSEGAVCLPVTGLRVTFQQPTGWDDLLLREVYLPPLTMAHAIAERLVRTSIGEPLQAAGLPVADFDALLLALRQFVFGDVIRAEVVCSVPECAARTDISFRISDYLASQATRTPPGIEEAGSGWYGLAGTSVRFRLPTGADLLSIAQQSASYPALVRLCISPPDVPAPVRKRVEKAMEALAPSLSRNLGGECPECHARLDVHFAVQPFVLRELYERAAGVYYDIHLLAQHYKWSEETILALPQKRRMRYVELLRNQGVAA